MSKTVVSIDGQRWCVNGTPTYPSRYYRDMKIEGLLMNARLVQGVFDDLNDETRHNWDYPDGPWDADRNTDGFVAAMPSWRRHGLIGFTINLQGGNPFAYSKDQPWLNPGFEPDGTLRDDYAARMARILDKADELGMVPIVGLFYFGQDEVLENEQAVLAATDNAVDWLLQRGYSHVVIEIANEIDNRDKYEHDILTPERVCELIRRVRERSAGKVDSPAGRLPASVSYCGGKLPSEDVLSDGDFVLLHGNGVEEPDRIRGMVEQVREAKTYADQPILFNEDDHFDFDRPDNNMLAAVSRYAGWGLFDWRMEGEGFEQGFQSVPTDWTISSDRKRGFFNLLAEMTGGQ
ncbi:MAG: hypothetical protein ACLFVW_09235 [Phycisphaerae bacterium]